MKQTENKYVEITPEEMMEVILKGVIDDNMTKELIITDETISVEISDELVVEVQPNVEHEWLLSSKDVAEGYGLSASGLRSVKSNYSDELLEGTHFIYSVSNRDGVRGASKTAYWTKEGVVMLGFFIKTPTAKEFRRWASNFIVEKSKESKAPSIPMTYIEALQAHLESVKQLEEANKVIALQAPKVEIYDDLMSKENLMYPMDGCRKLTANPKLLLNILKEKGYLFNNNKGELRPRAKALDKGWFVMREVPNYKDSEDKTREYMFMTLKGVTEIKPVADEAIAKGLIRPLGTLNTSKYN
ncbi:MAG: phage antirepressor KilAC domain-containing protein [Arcobacter sp.]|uniref:phage antirepressor KilAC domain-containing protein n=1 Tax=Arcobacter sp. TaxID=1872629 RepID=UPI00258D4CAF|nr:phage antirepressor KilAC domain-containing protein [Arcobacter sp.]MDD3009244.1 phage antirepressor KilAC domain-containing protein [Arcobacter sp.]